MKIINLSYRDPNGNPASAYVVRAWFADGGYSDGLYCANTKEQAFKQCGDEWEKHSPERKMDRLELLRIDGGIKDGEPVV
jgi:hypothetical protein